MKTENIKNPTPAFKGNYIGKRNMGYSTEPVKSSWYYLNEIVNTNSSEYIKNFWARRLSEKLLPDLKNMFKNDMVEENTSLFDIIISRGDDLKTLPEKNITYVNQRYKSTLQDYSPREIAYVLLSKDSHTEASDIIKYLDAKKEIVSEEEYNKVLLDVISGKTYHVNDIPKAKKRKHN